MRRAICLALFVLLLVPRTFAQGRIKDPSEFNAYLEAIGGDPGALEAFLQQYPNSVVKEEALELLMETYQRFNSIKVAETANRLLQVNPDNLRALEALTLVKLSYARNCQDSEQNYTEAAQYAQRGIRALQDAQKPSDESRGDWEALKTELVGVFNKAPTSSRDESFPQICPHIIITASAQEAMTHLVEKTEPEYPALARQAKIEGPVLLQFCILPDGAVDYVQALSGHPLLRGAAIQALKKWRYAPFIQNGSPVAATTQAEIDFALGPLQPRSHTAFPDVKNTASIIVTMDRGEYSLTVKGDGSVEFDGNSHVFATGKHHNRITAEEISQLIEAFRKTDYFSLEDRYIASASDASTTVTSITIDGQKKTVVDYLSGLKDLYFLEETIDRLAHSDQWVSGSAETVPNLLREGWDLNKPERDGWTLLISAGEYSNAAVAQALIHEGADARAHTSDGYTALMFAAERGLPEMVAALLAARADPSAHTKYGRTALMFGAESGNAVVVKQLLDTHPDVNQRSRNGDTALMSAAASGVPEVVGMLLHAGANVNARANDGTTALIACAKEEAPREESFDFENRADIREDAVDRQGVARILIRAGANVNASGRDGETSLFTLDDNLAREVIKAGINLNARNKSGDTTLSDTVSESLAQILIDAHADLNVADSKGETALMHASGRNYVGIVKSLTAAHADLNRRDKLGRTALHYAVDEALDAPVRNLIDAHIDVNARDDRGRTPLSIAREGLKTAREGYKITAYRRIILSLEQAGATE